MESSHSESCGVWGCRPRWLQRFATPRGFLLVYGLLGTTQAMSYIYFVATLTTMERRFKIPSSVTGLMLSGNEISQVILALILTYFGGRGNRPVWIAWGVAISALSCFILVLPQLIYGPGSEALALTREYIDAEIATNYGNNTWLMFATTPTNTNATFLELAPPQKKGIGATLCDMNDYPESDEDACEALNDIDTSDGSYAMLPIFLVFFSQFVLGIGTTLYFALGQIYLDDNVRKKQTPVLLGVTMALRTFGPVLGFVLGFGCLSIYVAPTLTPIINKKDPRWVGAWWLGWLILGSVMLLFAGLISFFPRHLPSTKQEKISSNTAVTDKLLPRRIEHPKPTWKEFPVALRRLLKNKLLMYNIVSSVFYILGASGFITFSTKYLEVQYQQAAAGGAMLAGAGGLVSMVFGFLISGYVISKFRPRPRLLLLWNVIAGSGYVVAEIIFIFLGCEDHTVHGSIPGQSLQLNTECNVGCNCPATLRYSPVCIGNTTFFSPCHAGCTTQLSSMRSNISFSSCECAADVFPLGTNMTLSAVVAKNGVCQADCGTMLIAFLIIIYIMHTFSSSSRVGNILVNFRCVEPQDKAFAQGLALGMISLFALIPGPILFGAIIDSTCIIWNNSCGKKGNCALYNKTDFRLYMNLTAASITTIAVILDAVVWYLGKNLDLYGEEATPTTNERPVIKKTNPTGV